MKDEAIHGGEGVGLDPRGLGALFPFHFVIDADSRLVQVGSSLERLCPEIELGADAGELFEILRPPGALEFRSQAAEAPAFLVLRARRRGVLLRGQTHLAGERLLFLVTPWITDSRQLAELGLSLLDFAPHDPMADYLLLLQNKSLALRDAEELARGLSQARETLGRALEDNERINSRLRALISQVPWAVLVEDQDGVISLVNEHFCGMFGLPGPEAVLGRPCAQLAEAACAAFREPQEFLAATRALLARRELCLGQELAMRDGRILERDHVPVRGPEGPMGSLWYYRDVTALRAQARELEDARRKAVEADHKKSEFLAMMNHEIRTPLAAVIGLSRLLQNELLPDTRKEYLRRLESSSGALMQLVQGTLDLARLEAQSMLLNRVDFDPVQLSRDVLDSFGIEAGQRGLELDMACAPGAPRAVLGDVGRVRQILVNLLGNALKFTEEGRVHMTLEAEAEADGARVRLRWSVQDTGPGLEPEELEQIFEPFVRIERQGRQRTEGSGLGLPIGRRLARAMGGEILARSSPGEGSTFTFLLPCERAPGPVDALVRGDGSPRRASALRVILADDDEPCRFVVSRLLQEAGHRVSETGRGEEALQLALSGGFDALVTDLRMPGIDGFDLLRALRRAEERQRRPRLPVVVLTADALPDRREQSFVVGADAFLTKPAKGEDLERVLAGFHSQAPRILVVEDSEPLHAVYRSTLEQHGWCVRTARHGSECLAILRSEPIDLVLLDLFMPGLSGSDLIACIRSLGARGELPILIVTGHDPDFVRQRELARGCDEILTKPVDPAFLAERIARALNLRSRA